MLAESTCTFVSFLEQGLSIIPIEPGHKSPIGDNWQQYSHKLPSPNQVLAWDRLRSIDPAIGFGIVLGPASGLIAIDIDKDEARDLIPQSPYVKRGLKGETRFFQFGGETARKWHGLGVELLSIGNQAVIPPTVHPAGMAYQWVGMYEGFLFGRIDLPKLPSDFIARMDLEAQAKAGRADHSPSGREVGGRRNKLKDMCVAALKDGKDDSTITLELLDWDKKSPAPWFRDHGNQERDAQHAVKFVQGIRQSIGAHSTPNDFTLALEEDDEEEEETYLVDPLKPQLSHYPETSGIMRDVFDLVQLRQPSEVMKPAALAASIAFMSMMLAQKFWGRLAPAGQGGKTITPNIYEICVASSGVGKDTPQQVLKELLIPRGVANTSKPKSGSALIKSLAKTPTRLDLMDETHSLLLAMGADQAHLREIEDFYMQLFSNAASVFGGSHMAYEQHSAQNVVRPHVSLLGFTTPTNFADSLNAKMQQSGFLARCLIFKIEGDRRLPNSASWDLDVDARISGNLKLAFEIRDRHRGNGALYSDNVFITHLTPDALSESDAFHQFCLENADTAAQSAHWCDSFYLRGREIACRLALMHHWSLIFKELTNGKIPSRTEIQIDSVQWGQAVWLSCLSSSWESMETLAVGSHDYSKIYSSISSTVLNAGWKPYSQAIKHHLAKREFPIALRNMLASGEIYKLRIKPDGKRKMGTYLVHRSAFKKLGITRSNLGNFLER